MKNKNRITALITCAAFLFVIVFSCVCILRYSEHVCVGEECRICCQIKTCVVVLKAVAGIGALIFVAMRLDSVLCEVSSFAAHCLKNEYTLVSLKVKLSN